MISAHVNLSGTIFDTRIDSIASDLIDQIAADYTEKAKELLIDETGVFRESTGRFVNSLRTSTRSEVHVVKAYGILYDDWLEYGGDSFSGYDLYEEATNKLTDLIESDSDSIVKTITDRLN